MKVLEHNSLTLDHTKASSTDCYPMTVKNKGQNIYLFVILAITLLFIYLSYSTLSIILYRYFVTVSLDCKETWLPIAQLHKHVQIAQLQCGYVSFIIDVHVKLHFGYKHFC